MKDNTILGYKCPTDLYGGEVKSGTLFTQKESGRKIAYYPENTGGDMRLIVPKEIAESWEPVYEDDFVKGDYIYVKNDGGTYSTHDTLKNKYPTYNYNKCPPKIVKFVEFTKIDSQGRMVDVIIVEDLKGMIYGMSYEDYRKDYIRKATTTEVDDFTTVVVGTYRGKFTEKTVTFGCKTFSKETVHELIVNNIESLTIEGNSVSAEKLRTIYSYFPK